MPHTDSTCSHPVVKAYIGVGANLGDAIGVVTAAVRALDDVLDTRLTACSSVYRTTPVDSSGPDYINLVAEVSTQLTAPDLLLQLQRMELAAGRERPYRNAPRTLDLDVLLYGDALISSPDLTVPHPRMNERAFVLVPLAEIAPSAVDERLRMAVADQGIECLGPLDQAGVGAV